MRFAISQPIQVQKPLARLINSLLLIPLAYRFEQLGLAGLHSGIGPSSALSIGVAIATYVQAKPTIRINILTARFMVFSLRCEVPGSGTSRWRNYTGHQLGVHFFLDGAAHGLLAAPIEH